MIGRSFWALACTVPMLAAPASAQEKTAEGAQKFLAALTDDGALSLNLREGTGASLLVPGTQTVRTQWLKDGALEADGPYATTQTPLSKQLSFLLKIEIDSVDKAGNSDPCTTRIRKISLASKEPTLGNVTVSDGSITREGFFVDDYIPYRTTRTDAFEDPLVRFAGPHYIDWGKVTITRTPERRIIAAARGPKFKTELHFVSEDPELVDRAEYAMKFLKASCDRMASTGF